MTKNLSISKRFFKFGALAVLMLLLGSTTNALSMKQKLKKGFSNDQVLAQTTSQAESFIETT